MFSKKEGKRENDKTSKAEPSISIFKTFNPTQEGDFNQESLLLDIQEKSKKIITLHFDLTKKLNENEKTIEDLTFDLKTLQTQGKKQKDAREEVLFFKEKIRSLFEANINLRKDLEILQQNIAQKDQYISLLKKNYSSRIAHSEIDSLLQKAKNETEIELSNLKKDIEILKLDIKEKDKHISALKKQSVRRELTFFNKQNQEREEQLKKLELIIQNKDLKIKELSLRIKDLSKMDPEQIAGLQDNLLKTQNELLEIKQQNKKLELTNSHLNSLIKTSGTKILELKDTQKEFDNINKKFQEEQLIRKKAELANKILLGKINNLNSNFKRSKQIQLSTVELLKEKIKETTQYKFEIKKAQKALKILTDFNSKIGSEMSQSKQSFEALKNEHIQTVKNLVQKYEQDKKNESLQYNNILTKIKEALVQTLKSKTLLESDKQKMKEKLSELSNLKKEMAIKEEYYKQVILKMTRQEIEHRSQIEVLKKL